MLTVLMKDIFVFSCGILIGVAFAFEVFQNQLQKEINYHYFRSYITKYGWEKNNEIPNTNRPPRKR